MTLLLNLRCFGSRAAVQYLDVFTVVASGRQLDASEGDWTLERDFDGSLLHAVLPVQSGVPRRGHDTAEVPLDWGEREGEGEREKKRGRERVGVRRNGIWGGSG